MSSGLFFSFFLGLRYTLGIPTGMNKTLQGDKPTRGGRVHGAEGETENIGTNSLMGPQLLRPLHFFFRVKRNRLGKSNSLDDWVKRSRLGKQQLGGATSSYALFFFLAS